MSAHTPGPWRVSGCVSGEWSLIEHGGEDTFSPIIAEVASDRERLPREANARLIAAAPDLLAALKATLDDLAWCSKHNGECLGDFPQLLECAKAHIKHARAIIAKATS